MHTEAINHDPAITFFQTGYQLAGRPSIGSWVSYGLGSENADLPAFVVMISHGTGNTNDQPLYDRLWGSGFLPSQPPGREAPRPGRPGAVPVQPAGHRRADAPRRCSTTSRELNRDEARGVRRPGDRDAHRAVRDGVPHAVERAGADRPLERAAATSRPVRPRGAASRGTLRRQLPARPPAGRARRAVRAAVPPRLGPARQPARRRSATSAATPTSRRPRWSRT